MVTDIKGVESENFNAIRISLASPEQILQWSYGEVTKPETHQLPDTEAGEGWPLLRTHLRSYQRLRMLLRKVQASPIQGHNLRPVRRRSRSFQG